MPWKPIPEQAVMVRLEGKVRKVMATVWNPSTGAVKVDWPPQRVAIASPAHTAHGGKMEIAKSRYEPLDPAAFKAGTKG